MKTIVGHFEVIASILLIGLCVAGCTAGSSTAGQPQVLDLSLTGNIASLSLSEISQETDLIPLQTNDSILLGQIVRIVQSGDFIYVGDKDKIVVFDATGKYVNRLCRQGQGPDEYLNITDFQVEKNGSVWIMSPNNRSLYHYHLDGRLLKKHQLPFWGTHLLLNHDATQMLVYVGNEKSDQNNDRLKRIDLSSGQIVENYFPIDTRKSVYLHVMSDHSFTSNSSDKPSYFYEIFNDTVYGLSAGQPPVPKYYVNFDGKNIPQSIFDKSYTDIMDFFTTLHKTRYAYGINLFMSKDDKFLISFIYDKKITMAWVDGEHCKTTSALREDLHLKGFAFELADQKLFPQSSEELIIPIESASVAEHMEMVLGEADKQSLNEKLGRLGLDQNPILIKVRL